MTFSFHTLESALIQTLEIPEVKADAQRCHARIVLEYIDLENQSKPLTIHTGNTAENLIVLKANAAVWGNVFSQIPPVGFQSIGALRRQCPEFSITGADQVIAQCLPFLERLLNTWRHVLNPQEIAEISWDGLENVRGSYLRAGSQKNYWMYQEQAGLTNGPALLMLHTAGADSRQWHGLMCDAKLQSQWSLHSFDLPGHGKSPLPPGHSNWNWRLTEADYLKWVIDYMDAAGIQKAVVMGCSMGAAIGLALMAKYPERLIGGVLLETPYRSPGRRSAYLNDSTVHGSRLGAAWVGSLLSPTSPQKRKDFATWIYSQAAPSVYDGDLAFYSDDFDARDYTKHIHTEKTPVWMLTGDYDYSATPADTLKVCNEIPGSVFVELKGFGHFPMVENPQELLPYLEQPLAELKKRC